MSIQKSAISLQILREGARRAAEQGFDPARLGGVHQAAQGGSLHQAPAG